MAKTIMYYKGGDNYIGEHPNKPVSYWRRFGKIAHQKYLYKGFKYGSEGKQQVVVFDTKKWSAKEKSRRKQNGFLGIKEYKL